MPQDVAFERKRYSIYGHVKRTPPDMDRVLHRIAVQPSGMGEARAQTDIQELAERDRKGVY